jgi:hypothetical protein
MDTIFPRSYRVTCLAVAASLAAVFQPDIAQAASISLEKVDSDFSVLFVEGELARIDVLTFERLANSTPTPSVAMFNSPGGDLLAGIQIGQIIRSKGMATAADTCASACALAWLAGRMRMASHDSRIGFHVAYVDGDLKTVTGTGNAMVGHYVGELGFGDNVVRYVTEAPPDGMTWLSFRDAELLGIEVTAVDDLLDVETGGSSNPAEAETAAIAPSTPKRPAFSDAAAPGFDFSNADRAVQNTLDRFGKAGMAGLVESSQACWEVAISKQQMGSVQYCRVLDIVARLLDEAAVSAYNFPQTAYFVADDRAVDLLAGLASAGITDANLALSFNELWQSQAARSMEAAAR